jgi:hypothetical protein
MPVRGGRSGGRSGGFRARASTPRSSSSGSRGFRVNFGNRASRASTSGPVTSPSTSTSNPTNLRPIYRPRLFGPTGAGIVWKTIAVIIGLFVLGACACVGLGFLVQAMGYGS